MKKKAKPDGSASNGTVKGTIKDGIITVGLKVIEEDGTTQERQVQITRADAKQVAALLRALSN